MSDELKAEVERLKTENLKLALDAKAFSDELKEVRGEARDRRHENKALAAQLTELTAERDSFRAKAETTAGEWQAKIDQLTGNLRGLKHDRAFETVAKRLKVSDPTRLADLVKLSGFAPEDDEPDHEKITGSFAAALKDRTWLLDPEPTPTTPADAGKPAAEAATITPACRQHNRQALGPERTGRTAVEFHFESAWSDCRRPGVRPALIWPHLRAKALTHGKQFSRV